MKKNIRFILSIGISAGLLFSCKKVTDFLDKPPGVDINEDIVFSRQVETERYVATLYQFGMTSVLPFRGAEAGFGGNLPGSNGAFNINMNASLFGTTDEAESSESFSVDQNYNAGNITPLNIVSSRDYRYHLRWMGIRVANILLERINEVPDASPEYKKMVTGEAQFIRALNNFEMFRNYGGFPIVNKRIVSIVESKIPRNTLEECVNAIVKDCDDAVANLPNAQTSAFTGRATIGAALALKARTLLYAASPLFNTGTPPSSYGSAEDNKLICYGNFDNNRWKLAADAAKAVLDWSGANGFALIDVPGNRIPTLVAGQRVSGNYRTAWEQTDNAEIILSSKIYGGPRGIFSFPWQFIVPRNDHVVNGGGFWTPPTVTFNFVRKYEKRDGTPQNWDYSGGNDLLQKYAELDPRFSQTVCYTGARLHSNVTRIQIWEGSASNKNTCKGGFWLLKHIPDALPLANQPVNNPIFRVNEMMLSYAEALNEFSGPSLETYDNVNRIRARSGMPNLPANLTKNAFRLRVQNERDIELAFEDHRFNDLRRWVIGTNDGVMNGDFWGLEITRLNNATPFPTAFSYKPFVFETRVFTPTAYLLPFLNDEVLKGNLKQNPGW